MVKESENHWDK